MSKMKNIIATSIVVVLISLSTLILFTDLEASRGYDIKTLEPQPLFSEFHGLTELSATLELPTGNKLQPITKLDFLEYYNGNIALKYDIVNDTANATVIFNSDSYTTSGWHANGGGGLAFDGSKYYYIHRERIGGSPGSGLRGYYLTLHESVNLVDWNQIWRVAKTNVTGTTVNSFERAVIRYWNNSYYLYFSASIVDDIWYCYYVKSATVNGLKTKLMSFSSWNQITNATEKDCFTGYIDSYYVLTSNDYQENNNKIYIADNPEFNNNKVFVIANIKMETNGITYDNTCGQFIYWASRRVDPDIYWYFYNSSDLKKWTFADSWKAVANSPTSGQSGNARYGDYCSINETNYIIIMEYDFDKDGDLETVLWDYTGRSNQAAMPVITRSLPSCIDPLQETFVVTINVSDYGAFCEINETLPSGISYVNSSLPKYQVTEWNNKVTFTLSGETTFIYTLTTPTVPGEYIFYGTLRDIDLNTYIIGGYDTVRVWSPYIYDTLEPLGVITKQEVISAIQHYFHPTTYAITKQQIIEVIQLYVST